MCGIAGFADIGRWQDAPDLLKRMIATLRHRGPDAYGLYMDRHVGLASTRLAILDLANGHQPMIRGDCALVFNGEIFNYRELAKELYAQDIVLQTGSDTEVLLQCLRLWGIASLEKLEGQFAFAFLDGDRNCLLLGRDRFGERPLFFTEQSGGLVFGSEIKALFSVPGVERQLSSAALSRTAHLWTCLPDETVFSGIRAIPPGHFLLWQRRSLRLGRYYTVPFGAEAEHRDYDEAIDQVRLRLRQSVRLRLRSDVPVAAYVSGGLDSAIVARLAAEESSDQLKTFSISFDAAAYDEASYQALVAESLGSTHHTLRVSGQDIARVFPDVVQHTETALFRTAPAPMFLLAREVKKAGIKVILTGEGADESFLGYDIFKESLFREDLDGIRAKDDDIERLKMLYSYLPHFSSAAAQALLSFFRRNADNPADMLFSHRLRLANGPFTAQLFVDPCDDAQMRQALIRAAVAQMPAFANAGLIERCQALEVVTLLSGYLLSSQGDRMTAAHGVEGRSPFLDTHIVDFAAKTPRSFRLTDSLAEKQLLKDAFAQVVPAAVIQRPKQPYRAPDACCFLAASAPDWVADITTPAALLSCPVLDRHFVERFLAKLRKTPLDRISPREDAAFILLLSTLLLQQTMIDAAPSLGGEDLPYLQVYIDRRGE